jgi:hypothetical protein
VSLLACGASNCIEGTYSGATTSTFTPAASAAGSSASPRTLESTEAVLVEDLRGEKVRPPDARITRQLEGSPDCVLEGKWEHGYNFVFTPGTRCERSPAHLVLKEGLVRFKSGAVMDLEWDYELPGAAAAEAGVLTEHVVLTKQ